MGTIWVRQLTGGLDTRRMPETTPGGVLIRANNGHISRGGEFEQRASFVPFARLPEGTVGVAHSATGVIVFSSDTISALPVGVHYQKLVHPDGTTSLARILSTDLFAGKVYVVAEFADGSIYHYYNGVRVTEWYDGKARASFAVTGGNVSAPSTVTFSVVAGTGASSMTSLKIDSVEVLNGTVTWATSHTNTATLIKNSINAATSSPEYTATSSGASVTISRAADGTTPNGRSVIPTLAGGFAVSPSSGLVMAGGANTSTMTALKINGVDVLGGTISWATSNTATAAAIAAAINATSAVYTAVNDTNTVKITAVAAGSTVNARTITPTLKDGFALTPSAGLVMSGGFDAVPDFGTLALAVQSKMYSVSGSNLMFSGVADPTRWTTDATGAGFIDMSSEASGSEDLTAIARYQDFLAVFAESTTLILYIDPDPTLNRVKQVLNNTGTSSPLSVTQFGDNDIFYLDESGLRSLKARDSSNAAATTDIGVPIDSLVVEKLLTFTDDQRSQIIGLINPGDGRFWLIMLDQIYVFSFYQNAKVSAWSTYTASYMDGASEVPFEVEAATVFNRHVYVRSGDQIYVYGGLGSIAEYDATPAEAWLPFFDADRPTQPKSWTGIDAAVEGQWEIEAAMQPTNLEASDVIARIYRTSYNEGTIGMSGRSTHIGLRFISSGVGPHKLSAAVIHYEGGGDEN